MLGLLRARNAAASLERDASQTVPVTTYWAAELAELQRALLDLRKLLHTNSFPKAL
uniref:tRNA(Ile)-lysidine synthase (TRNA(Ile)-lysidine synthetase) (TRNA(Ile)-2-lysyl-cytidine synthase) n=1 Tax=mine drainage metagenome TaxID=410659 RepID=E6QIA5_9ZZZZ